MRPASRVFHFAVLAALMIPFVRLQLHGQTPSPIPLQYGTTIADLIECGARKTYTVSGNKDDKLLVHLTETNDFGGVCNGVASFAFDQCIEVRHSDGSMVGMTCTPSSSNSRSRYRTQLGPLSLPRDGSYILTVRDVEDNGRGAFALFTQKLTVPAVTVLLGSNDTRLIPFQTPGEAKTFLINAVQNHTISVDLRTVTGTVVPKLGLYGPDGLPLVFDTNGVIRHRAQQTGQYTLLAFSNVDETGTAQLVVATSSNGLEITRSTLPAPALNTSYSQTLSANGGMPPYDWSVVSGGLPPGLTFSSSGELKGAPTITGSFGFTVRAKDTAGSGAMQAFSLTTSARLLITSNPTIPSGTVNAPYSQALAATGGTPPYTWGLAAEEGPDGLSLSNIGTIAGTPTTAGNFTFSVRVADTGVSTTTQAFSLTISPALAISTEPLLSPGTIGKFFSHPLEAAGGTVPYRWSLVSGSLPPGLSISTDGVIAGIPTATGARSFTVRVTDAKLLTATRTFGLSIAPNSGNVLSLPQIADGLGWKTLFALVNLDSITISYAVRFWNGTGQPLNLPFVGRAAGNLSGTLAPGRTLFVETPGTATELMQGWAEVEGSGRIGATAIFGFVASSAQSSEGSSSATFSGSNIQMPFDNTQGRGTGVAIANTNATRPLTVSLTLETDASASTIASVTLPAHGHTAFMLATMFPATAGARGSIRFTAESPDISVLGLRFTPSMTFTSLGAFQ